MARKFTSIVSKILVFWRGDYNLEVRIDPPDGDDDLYVRMVPGNGETEFSQFIRRDHARQLARALLDAADA